uniref:Uncharacterized protein n=1 Tax=Solanum lycopersicum TaxID=4081 RepID=A0A3Q7FML7_SOLLC
MTLANWKNRRTANSLLGMPFGIKSRPKAYRMGITATMTMSTNPTRNINRKIEHEVMTSLLATPLRLLVLDRTMEDAPVRVLRRLVAIVMPCFDAIDILPQR